MMRQEGLLGLKALRERSESKLAYYSGLSKKFLLKSIKAPLKHLRINGMNCRVPIDYDIYIDRSFCRSLLYIQMKSKERQVSEKSF
jgi:hypothetical protein